MTIDEAYLTAVLQRLVQINSVNPSLSPTGPGESEIAGYVARTLTDIGLEVQTIEPEPGRVSVVGRLAGRTGTPSLMLNAHADTVGVDGMAEPFSGAIRNGRLYGRGAVDMKGSLAAQIAAAKALVDSGQELNGDLYIAAVADEEYASIGVQSIVPHFPVDAAIVTEPSDLEISVAHKGFIWIEVTTSGTAYHGSRPDLGVDANMRMGRFLARLGQLEQELRQRPPHPYLGPPSLHVATLNGGTEFSIYSASCTAGIERRTVPGETAAQVENEIRSILDELQAADPTFEASMTIKLVRDPFEVDEQAPIVQALRHATTTVLGQAAPLGGQMFWTDAAFHAAAGTETVLIGPQGHGLHAAEEWVDLNSVKQLAAILVETIATYLA